MVMEAEKALRDIVGGLPKDHPDRGFVSEHLSGIEYRARLAYLDFDKFPTTEAEVKEELARQADKYLKLGLNRHPQIKMSRGKFKDSIVVLAGAQTENFKDRVDIPIAVLGQVPAKDVYEADGVKYWLDGLNVRDWPDDPFGFLTPRITYLSWMNDGAVNLKREVADVRANLETDLRGATESDGSGLYVAHPRILEHHFIDFPGTSGGSVRAPYLKLFDDGPRLSYGWVGDASPRFGSALCGRIGT